MESKAVVSLTNGKKAFGDNEVLKDISLTVNAGDVLAIIGPSGGGKSTLLRCMTLLETLDSGDLSYGDLTVCTNDAAGRAVYGGKDVIAAAKTRFGLVFQNFNLFPHYTVLQNVTDALICVQKMPKDEALARGRELLARMGLADKESMVPCDLSGGQQQRVAIARTLAPEPKVLFMDEPLSNLDAKLRLEMRYELQRLHVETGSTFVYVTHDQMEAMTLATQICLIENGVLQQYDAPLTVYNRPNNLFVADFVGNPSINFVEAKGKQREDGAVELTVFRNRNVTFHPSAKLDLAGWFQARDKAAAEKADVLKAKAAEKSYVEKGNKDEVFRYHIAKVKEDDFSLQEEPVITNEDFVLGIRPEAIDIVDSGHLDGEIYGAMPTGMESTIKVRVDDFLLTGVVFGSTLFTIGTKAHIDISGENIMLFDRKSGICIAVGSLEL